MDKNLVKQKIEDLFKKYNKKDNNYLTIKELKLFMEDIFEDSSDEVIENEIKKIMKDMNKNQDDKLSKKEMINYLLK